MTRTAFAAIAAAVLLSASAAAHAQMPSDNDAWKARCSVLANSAADLNKVSPAVVALTRGVSGAKFVTFAFDRDAAGQHNVACTLFYLGAVAEHAGNGGKADNSSAQDDAVLAGIEVKTIHGQSTTFSESLTRTKVKAYEITHPALTQADEEAVMNAATTIPYTQAAGIKTVAALKH